MKETLRKLGKTDYAYERQKLEMELLNDYNYLKAKAKRAKEDSLSKLNESVSNFSTPHTNDSFLTGKTD